MLLRLFLLSCYCLFALPQTTTICMAQNKDSNNDKDKESYEEQTEEAEKSYLTLQASDSEYFKNMEIAITVLDQAKTTNQVDQAISFFTQIASEQTDEWLPPYYAAYGYIQKSLLIEDKVQKDEQLNLAQQQLDKAFGIQSNNPEIMIMQAYVFQEKFNVYPSTRMEDFGTLVQITYEDVAAIEPNNPRLHTLQAITTFFTPEAYGGGMQKACPMVTQAQEMYKLHPPENSIAPKWGQALLDYMNYICDTINKDK